MARASFKISDALAKSHCFQSHLEHIRDFKLNNGGERKHQKVILEIQICNAASYLWVVGLQCEEVDAILWSDAKEVNVNHYFLAFAYFFSSMLYFFLVLVFLKFHHSKFHACKQPRNFVNSLWIRCFTTASQTPLLKDVKTASFKCVCLSNFLSKVMEKHIRLLEALCRICGGNIRGNDRVKLEVARL